MQVERRSSNTKDPNDLTKDTTAVTCLRILLVLTLATAATLVAVFTYLYVSNVQKEEFERQYYDSVVRVAQGFQYGIDTKAWTASTFSAMYTSRYGPVDEWPNATMPDFQEQAYGQLKLSDGRALSFNPIITNETREGWEAHATENAYILGAPQLIERTDENSRIVADGIYQKKDGVAIDDPGYAPGSRYPYVMVPVWQIAPIVTNEKAVMFNLHSETNRQRALDDMLYYKVPALTAILQLVQDSELRPSSILFFPVFGNFTQDDVVGSISVVFSWDTVLSKLLPDYINGIVCVLKTNTGQSYTYSINGETVSLMGEGDLHDPNYDSMKTSIAGSLEGTDKVLGEVDNLITYSLDIYPSAQLESQYVTNAAQVYTVVVVMIFFITSALFLLYDLAVKHRQNVIVRAAVRSRNIVDSFFPANFRDRLFRSQEEEQVEAEALEVQEEELGQGRRMSKIDMIKCIVPEPLSRVVEKPTSVMKKFLTPEEKDGGLSMTVSSEPIADLFPSATVMFADIAGFTSWSSERDPSHVFRLLEALFKEFDSLATTLGVFKISTIGDCYLATCGLPDARDDHAEVMSLFSIECQNKFRLVVEDLKYTLGPDTSTLRLRSGLHSGPVTAGVLRGLRSRFEVFGDTVNTASRMESTGIPCKIQISKQTAQLLKDAGRDAWIEPRKDLVTAKGKGKMETFWLLCGDEEKEKEENSKICKIDENKSLSSHDITGSNCVVDNNSTLASVRKKSASQANNNISNPAQSNSPNPAEDITRAELTNDLVTPEEDTNEPLLPIAPTKIEMGVSS